jgi:hypothetical protein
MRTAAGPARYQAAFSGDHGQRRSGVGGHVHHGAARLAAGVPIPGPRHCDQAKPAGRALAARSPASGWRHRVSHGETPLATRLSGPVTRMSRRRGRVADTKRDLGR